MWTVEYHNLLPFILFRVCRTFSLLPMLTSLGEVVSQSTRLARQLFIYSISRSLLVRRHFSYLSLFHICIWLIFFSIIISSWFYFYFYSLSDFLHRKNIILNETLAQNKHNLEIKCEKFVSIYPFLSIISSVIDERWWIFANKFFVSPSSSNSISHVLFTNYFSYFNLFSYFSLNYSFYSSQWETRLCRELLICFFMECGELLIF